MFVVSNAKQKNTETQYGSLWIHCSHDTVIRYIEGNYLYLFSGRIYEDCHKTMDDVIDLFLKNNKLSGLKEIKGRYAGIFYNYHDTNLFIYNDQNGEKDIYYWWDGATIIVSDKTSNLIASLNIKKQDLNQDAIDDYLALGYTVGEHTFVKNLYRKKPGVVFEIENNRFKKHTIWSYVLSPIKSFNNEQAIEQLDQLFMQAVKRIISICGENEQYCIGLSDGFDSRLAAYYFLKEKAKLFAFFFGELSTIEAGISERIAGILNLPLYKINNNREFPNYFRQSIMHYPFGDLEWCKYLTGRQNLPDHTIILSGFLGNQLFGGWEFGHANEEIDDHAIALQLYERMTRARCSDRVKDGIVARIEKLIGEDGGSTISKKCNFWYRSSDLFGKNCGLFDDLHGRKHYSLFYDCDLIDFCLTIPYRLLFMRRFYHSFFEKKIPDLSQKSISNPPKINSHKPVELWLKENKYLRPQTLDLLKDAEHSVIEINNKVYTIPEAVEKIYAGSFTRNEIHEFFRRFTIEVFKQNYVK